MTDLVHVVPLPDGETSKGGVLAIPQSVFEGLTPEMLDRLVRPAPEPLPTVAQALSAAAADVGPITKDQTHGTGNQAFKYRGIEQIMEQAGPALRAAGVTFLPSVLGWEYREVMRGDPPKAWRLITATVAYEIVGPAGDSLNATVVAEGLDNGDKAAAKVMTMAFKSCLLQVLGIGTGHDDTDDETYPEPSEQRTATRAASRTTKRASKATAKSTGSGARKAAPASRPAPARKTPEEQVERLLGPYGAEHAAGVAALITRMDGMPEGPERGNVKAAFVEAFGRPDEIEPPALDEATAWVTLAVSLGAVPVADANGEPLSPAGAGAQPTDAPSDEAASGATPAGEPICSWKDCGRVAIANIGEEWHCASHEPF